MHMTRRGPPSTGFTLFEVMIVMFIAAVIYGILVAAGGRSASMGDLKASARMLASGLRQAQSTAMATRRDALMTVDLDSREFQVSGQQQAQQLPEKVELKLYTAQAEVTSERRGAIRFYPDGSSTGGRITVSSGERRYLVDVDWITGRVSVKD